jgi:hypothetical protein
MAAKVWRGSEGATKHRDATARRWLGGVVSLCLAAAASAAGASTVTTIGYFYGYEGPVGAPIYAGSPPFRDAAPYASMFLLGVGSNTQQIQITPQVPYPGYEDPAFAGTGTVQASLGGYAVDTARVEFWSQITPGQDETHNVLQITSTITPGIAVGDVFKLATISFTNGDWFRVEPLYDPGLGPLYPESLFSFALFAYPDPIIGSGYLPGPPPYHLWTDALELRSVAGAGTPDRLSFSNSPALGSFTVAEGVTGTVEVWGRIGSLEPLELRNPSAGVTLLPAPEPGAGALLCVGGVLVALRARRKAAELSI